MRDFLNENFLLYNPTAINLYHTYAKHLPIIDYHCHIKQNEIYENKQFNNITEIWLQEDHYKWRLMRCCGVPEHLITGNASSYDKFLAWAGVVPKLIGNPLHHWTHLELQRYFDIYDLLNLDTAPKIWDITQKKLTNGKFKVQDILLKSNIEFICTTDDPIDDLNIHQKLKDSCTIAKIMPAWRPDKAIKIAHPNFNHWRLKLSQLVDFAVDSYAKLLQALIIRMDFFQANGCTISDHALDYVPYLRASNEQLELIFAKASHNQPITLNEEQQYRTELLLFLGEQYHKRDWVMQLHLNAARDNNTYKFNQLGSDTGFDTINDNNIQYQLSNLLNALELKQSLPKTILYSLNPRDNIVISALINCFQGENISGKMQFGAAWWFNDHKDGIETQLQDLANVGVLSNFIGMLTDSRSFLSYTRHEYFRRILCNFIGTLVENGEYPNDHKMLAQIVENICYYNAKAYFKI
ncbi:MAG: glucuronate isomerase [Burkholderiales bacterium]|nr:glucuronate isomerase [Burkholderiales bacterium]